MLSQQILFRPNYFYFSFFCKAFSNRCCSFGSSKWGTHETTEQNHLNNKEKEEEENITKQKQNWLVLARPKHFIFVFTFWLTFVVHCVTQQICVLWFDCFFRPIAVICVCARCLQLIQSALHFFNNKLLPFQSKLSTFQSHIHMLMRSWCVANNSNHRKSNVVELNDENAKNFFPQFYSAIDCWNNSNSFCSDFAFRSFRNERNIFETTFLTLPRSVSMSEGIKKQILCERSMQMTVEKY